MSDPGELDEREVRALAREIAELAKARGFRGKVLVVQNGRHWAVIVRLPAPHKVGEYRGYSKREEKLRTTAGEKERVALWDLLTRKRRGS